VKLDRVVHLFWWDLQTFYRRRDFGFISPSGVDIPGALALDSSNQVYLAGTSFSSNMPVTASAKQDMNLAATQDSSTTGSTNAFLAEFDTTSNDCSLAGITSPTPSRTPTRTPAHTPTHTATRTPTPDSHAHSHSYSDQE
jgi:hypothetical protein